MMLKEIVHYVINFIFPKRCIICDEVLTYGANTSKQYICENCKDKIDFIDDLSCKKCGAKINDKNEHYCERCKSYENGKESYYEYGFGLCRYNDYVKESIHRIKYNGRKEYIEVYGKLIAIRYFEKIKSLNIDCFVPVPIHNSRMKERNYNQATILAKYISDTLHYKGLDIPVNETLIKRVKKTEVLNKLSEDKRKDIMKNAFLVNNEKNIKSVCLVDIKGTKMIQSQNRWYAKKVA